MQTPINTIIESMVSWYVAFIKHTAYYEAKRYQSGASSQMYITFYIEDDGHIEWFTRLSMEENVPGYITGTEIGTADMSLIDISKDPFDPFGVIDFPLPIPDYYDKICNWVDSFLLKFFEDRFGETGKHMYELEK